MMKRISAMLLIVMGGLCFYSATGQSVPAGTIPVYQTRLVDSQGSKVNGITVCAEAMSDGRPISVRVGGGGGVAITRPVCTTVSDGAWSLFLPDGAHSSPLNAKYSLTAIDNNTGENLLAGYSHIQPSSVAPDGTPSWWCSATSCSIDDLDPEAPSEALKVTGNTGAQGQPGCSVSAGDCTGLVSVAPSSSTHIVQPAGTSFTVNNTIIDNVVSITAFGADPTGHNDSSAALIAARYALLNTGGIIVWPAGTYKLAANLSLCTAPATPIINQGWGAVVVPGDADYLIKIDNTSCSSGYVGSNLKFIGFSWWGQAVPSGTLTPTIDNLFYLKGTEVELENNRFSSCLNACLYGWYAQYTRSTDDTFSAGKTSGAMGIHFTGGSAASASNEIVFIRPRFNTNTKAGQIEGSFSPTFIKPEIQNNTSGLTFDSDPSGQSTTAWAIHNFYSELNSGPAIVVGTAQRGTIDGGSVLDMASVEPLWLYTTTSYGLSVSGVNSFGAGASINHPSTNADTASLTWENNNMLPTLGLTHPGPTELSIKTSGGDSTEQVGGNYVVTASGSASIAAQVIALRTTNGSGTVNIGLKNSTFLYKFNPVTTQTADHFVNLPDANVDLTPLGIDLTGTGCNAVLIDSANHFHRGVSATGC